MLSSQCGVTADSAPRGLGLMNIPWVLGYLAMSIISFPERKTSCRERSFETGTFGAKRFAVTPDWFNNRPKMFCYFWVMPNIWQVVFGCYLIDRAAAHGNKHPTDKSTPPKFSPSRLARRTKRKFVNYGRSQSQIPRIILVRTGQISAPLNGCRLRSPARHYTSSTIHSVIDHSALNCQWKIHSLNGIQRDVCMECCSIYNRFQTGYWFLGFLCTSRIVGMNMMNIMYIMLLLH